MGEAVRVNIVGGRLCGIIVVTSIIQFFSLLGEQHYHTKSIFSSKISSAVFSPCRLCSRSVMLNENLFSLLNNSFAAQQTFLSSADTLFYETNEICTFYHHLADDKFAPVELQNMRVSFF